MNKAKNVDEYIRSAPKGVRAKLTQIRRIIKSVAPKANEMISYRIPYYSYKGRLIYFAHSRKHVALYGAPLKDYTKEMKRYQISKGTIAFPLDKPLPAALIRKIVKARVKNNEGKRKD